MTGKAIPTALVDTYAETTTALGFLLKITARDGTVVGVTSAEEPVDYNDGTGEITYSAAIGYDAYAFETSADLGVDNSEGRMLIADSGMFSDEQIEAGVLDYGEYVVYRVNRLDLAQGHEIVDVGTIGIAKRVDGLAAVVELRSLQQQLKQTYGSLYSLTCRARFGSGGGGSGCAVARGQCGFDAESLWQNHSVSSVGSETDRIFTADSTPAVNGPNGALTFAPGIVHWLTGSNAGKQSEIEAITGAEITLRFGTPYTIEATDTFKIRPDCDKTWETCRDDYDNILNFRGEPKIPLADEGTQIVPNYSGTWSVSKIVPETEPQ